MTEIGLLNYPGSQQAALYGMTDLFLVASESGDSEFRVTRWRMEGEQLVCDFDSKPGTASRPDAIIVPGTMERVPSLPKMKPCLQWLKEQHGKGGQVCSVCWGAFVLAAADLLDGRRCTTHWLYAPQLAESHPRVKVDSDRLLVDEGDIITAGGVMAWVDLSLHLVDRFAGPRVMLETARLLLVDPPRREQRFYSTFTPPLDHGDEIVLQVQHWLQQSYAETQSVGALAERSQMSERTFLRRFQKATGLKPTEYVQSLRVGKAREALEFSRDSINEIAWRVGYEDPGAFRKIFRRIIGLSPREYRRRFGAPGVN